MSVASAILEVDYRALALWAIDVKTMPSSKLMARVALGIPLEKRDSRMHPTDASDMRSCITLVRDVPGIRERLEALRFLSPVWNGLVDVWSELEQAYDRDLEIEHERDLQWDQALKEANEAEDNEEGARIVEAFEELSQPKSVLQRRLWVVLEKYGGSSYHGWVAAYDHADDPIELDEFELDDILEDEDDDEDLLE